MYRLDVKVTVSWYLTVIFYSKNYGKKLPPIYYCAPNAGYKSCQILSIDETLFELFSIDDCFILSPRITISVGHSTL